MEIWSGLMYVVLAMVSVIGAIRQAIVEGVYIAALMLYAVVQLKKRKEELLDEIKELKTESKELKLETKEFSRATLDHKCDIWRLVWNASNHIALLLFKSWQIWALWQAEMCSVWRKSNRHIFFFNVEWREDVDFFGKSVS
ncbi:hypothetical protein RHGRI_033205 [Rhododendron griersonianum]|uniref:Uncharacterized protein n=1 Tax=Rhododendron griersonianum TaxID=479676 RepID=A0AAV6HZ54_9ERIC|nr:hypothetical protein RHGRI_033205 [Rhododendron griersonianum]